MKPKKTYKIFCKAGPEFALTIKEGKVVLAPSNILDKKQHWYKIEKNYKKDDETIPAFVLVNKATGQTLHNAVQCDESVQLSSKDPNVEDKYLLWTKGKEVGNGLRPVRMASNNMLNLDVSGGGFVENGTRVIVSKCKEKSDTQLWNILQYSTPYKIYCKRAPNFYLTIRHDKVILAPANPFDKSQFWYKDKKYSERVKDEDGSQCFALVNKATGQAINHSAGSNRHVHLVSYNPTVLDESVLWTQGKQWTGGYKTVRMVNNPRLIWHANGDKVHDGTDIITRPWNEGDNQQWIVEQYCKFLENARGLCNHY